MLFNTINPYILKHCIKNYLTYSGKKYILSKPCVNKYSYRQISTTSINNLFWERDRKSGYNTNVKISQKQLILDGLKELKSEISLWRNEIKEKLLCDPVLVFRPGETDVAWQFSTKKDIDNWVVTTDKDHNEGHSEAEFKISPSGYGHFHGNVDAKLPKDGKIKKAGYCNIKSIRTRKSFKRESFYDWRAYNTLVIRLRGDGRSYLINLSAEGYFDIMWNDVYHYILYTRGGPHWQTARIPFSKFFLSSKGRVQDKQCPIALDKVTNIGFSVGARGGYGGQFSLEIDYIGLEYDPNHNETFAYEMYKQDKYIAAT